MAPVLQFRKNRNKPTTLTVIRTDGSSTWTKLQPGLEAHDLAHFAVESILGFTQAFYGLLDQGYEVGDFELPREKRPAALIPANLPVEALQTEHIVNLLLIEQWNSGGIPDFLATLSTVLESQGLAFPTHLDGGKLQQIWEKYRQLVFEWYNLAPGEVLEVSF